MEDHPININYDISDAIIHEIKRIYINKDKKKGTNIITLQRLPST